MANQSTVLIDSVHASDVGINITLPILSEKAKGCGYHGQTSPLHTVQFTTVGDFVGTIVIQGSLATTPTEDDWYDITSYGDAITPVTDGAVVENFAGQHVWVRSKVTDFTAGEINRVLFTHN